MNAGTPRATAARGGGRWLVTRTRRPDAVADLYCFVHAGGSPGEYVRFGDELPELQVYGVQLPGRAARRAEPAVTGMPELVDAVVEALDPQRPFAFLGHSLGGLVAFEVTRALRDRGRELPRRLYLSSSPPPPHTRGRTVVHTLPDEELLAEIERRWGELPAQVHTDATLREMVLEVFRADLGLFETYRYAPGPPLEIPVSVFAGDQERTALHVENWQAHTTGPFDVTHLPGGHFYFRDPQQRRELLARIRESMAAPPGAAVTAGATAAAPEAVTVLGRAGGYHVLTLAAGTPQALDEATGRIRDHLAGAGPAPAPGAGAEESAVLPYRRFAIGETHQALVRALAKPAAPAPKADGPRIAFVFPGQGSQYARMGLRLAQDLPLFGAELDACLTLLEKESGHDLRPVLAAAAGDGLQQTGAAQPALFVLEYALARTWQRLGVRPAAMIGHSLGEYVAATLAGVMPLREALGFVALRARLMQRAPTGAMLAVPLPEERLAPYLERGADLATVNAPASCVLAGTEETIARVEDMLTAAGTPGRRLRVSHAFHSRLMDGCVDELRAAAARIGLRPPTERFVSGVTGTWITADQATDPDYWARHLRQPVRFSDAVGTVLAEAPDVVLETGPGPALTSLVKRRPDLPPHTVALSSLPHPGGRTPEPAGLLATLGGLWQAGARVDWQALCEQHVPVVPLAA
ncbi:acyltransferase domain-containing protein [Streptomyces sioyaensis]|uniref:acyltransferase domain-containing protein n=1 Tax=Streptomyces sioyaensis TaxID=67364 RepID=UPI0037AB69DB